MCSAASEGAMALSSNYLKPTVRQAMNTAVLICSMKIMAVRGVVERARMPDKDEPKRRRYEVQHDQRDVFRASSDSAVGPDPARTQGAVWHGQADGGAADATHGDGLLRVPAGGAGGLRRAAEGVGRDAAVGSGRGYLSAEPRMVRAERRPQMHGQHGGGPSAGRGERTMEADQMPL